MINWYNKQNYSNKTAHAHKLTNEKHAGNKLIIIRWIQGISIDKISCLLSVGVSYLHHRRSLNILWPMVLRDQFLNLREPEHQVSLMKSIPSLMFHTWALKVLFDRSVTMELKWMRSGCEVELKWKWKWSDSEVEMQWKWSGPKQPPYCRLLQCFRPSARTFAPSAPILFSPQPQAD